MPAWPPRMVIRRSSGLRTLESALYRAGLGPVAGVDEVGRGACAGPLVVAACVLGPNRLESLAALAEKKPPVRLVFNRKGLLTSAITEETLAALGVSIEDIEDWGGSVQFQASGETSDRDCKTLMATASRPSGMGEC